MKVKIMSENESSGLSMMDSLVASLVEQKAAKKRLEDQAAACEEGIRNQMGKILAHLKEAGLKTFKGSLGTVTSVERTSYKMPSDEESLTKLQAWYEEKGLRHMLKPNSISHNSLMAKEYEMAKAKGDPFFEVPGAGQPLVSVTLSLTEKKG